MRTASCSASTFDCLSTSVGDQLVLRQRLVHLGLHLRLVVFGLDGRGGGSLLQLIVLQLDAEVGLARLGRLELQLGVLQLLLELQGCSARG